MEISVQLLREKFNHFNRLCFAGTLPPITMRVGRSTRSLGTFRHPRVRPSRPDVSDCVITISGHFDFSPEQIEDTIIHEMIHYYIWWHGIKDSSAHGPRFREMMNRINTLHHRHITVTSRETTRTPTSRTLHYICILTDRAGKRYITRMARSRIFDIYRQLQRISDRYKADWYISYDNFFESYPRSNSLKIYSITDREYLDNIEAGAIPCQCDGRIFKLANQK